MNKRWLFLNGIAWSILLVLVLISVGAIKSPSPVSAQEGVVTPEVPAGEDGGQGDTTLPGDESDNMPPAAVQEDLQPESQAAPNTGSNTLVYFSPQDSSGTGTVIMLYNISAVTATVNLKGYQSGNFLGLNRDIIVGPGRLIHVISDLLEVGAPPSWTGTNNVLVNFTDYVTYVIMSIPAGVKLDGYVIFNFATGVIDPNNDQGAIPLRFSTDPLMTMLPAVMKKP